MTASTDRADLPMAEPGKRNPGADVGGMHSSADAGVADSLQRSTERGDDPGIGRAVTGDASGGAADPRVDLGGKDAPGSAPGAASRSDRPASDDRAASSSRSRDATPDRRGAAPTPNDDDEWRHALVAPVDEGNPLRSLGKAIGDSVTGSGPGADPATPLPSRSTSKPSSGR